MRIRAQNLACEKLDLSDLIHMLKSIAVGLDRPEKVELVFDVIAIRELENTSRGI